MHVLTSLITLLVTITTALYRPSFALLPVVRQPAFHPETTFELPVKKLTATQVPPIQAGAFLVVDVASSEALAERSADVELPPASTTKMMTAIVAIEGMDQDAILSVPADLPREGSVMKLKSGERIRVRDVITGLLIHSSNDAAELLAREFPGGESAFIEAMNAKAHDLFMDHTHFENPSGLPQAGHITTVRDLLILGRYAMQNPFFAETVKRQSADIRDVSGKIVHHVETTNKLLGTVDGVEGIKTGWTEEAGECLVAQVTRDGHTVLTALLRSPDRFAETKLLIDWVYSGFTWQTKTVAEWAE